ncbi:uncharacterized protein ACIBXB_002572 [Morphnus guianensis]
MAGISLNREPRLGPCVVRDGQGSRVLVSARHAEKGEQEALLALQCCAQLWSPRLSRAGLLPGTCRAGRSGWSGLRGDELWAGEQSPRRGVQGAPFSARSSPCPQLPRAARCPHPTRRPVLPRTLTPSQPHSRGGASAASSLRRRLSAASRARPDTSSCSSGLDSLSSRPSTPESWTRQQEPSPVPGKPARLPQSARERASASPDSRPARPPPPRPPWLSNSASRVLRDQPSDLEPPEELQPPARAPSPSRRPSCKGLSQPRQGMGLGYGDRLLTDSFRDRPFMSE